MILAAQTIQIGIFELPLLIAGAFLIGALIKGFDDALDCYYEDRRRPHNIKHRD